MNEKITVAIAGNPNSGKTTVFNAITGFRQHVANYPGVTVEIKEGLCAYSGYDISIVDLPGTYSLTAYSAEELLARNYIVDNHPDVVLDILDSSNLERNLYLATQLMEMNVPLVLVFNMSDIAAQRGFKFDIKTLSELFASPVVTTVASRAEGIDDILDAIVKLAKHGPAFAIAKMNYGNEIEEELAKIQLLLNSENDLVKKYGSRWLSLKLLENDPDITAKERNEEVIAATEASRSHLISIFGDEPATIIAERRYGFISGACQEAVQTTTQMRHDISDRIDAVLTHRILGLPIFIVMMYLTFQLTFSIGSWPMGWLESFFSWASVSITTHWPGGYDSLLLSLLVDGIIGGVGGVIVFLPNIILLFAAIAILEDSGYMARAAFIMDHIMHKIGLHGKSFIPMLIGFGCSVPAIMATRILENRRNRIATIMVIPLISCGAKFTIYAMLIPAFFRTAWRGPALLLIYVIGIVLAIICVRLLRETLLKGQTIPFVMELPPYRLPTVRSIATHTWHRGWMYLRKAGTIILAVSIILWVAGAFPRVSGEDLTELAGSGEANVKLNHSIIGKVGRAIEPVMKPLGFDWRISTALIGSFAAKEVFVSQMGIIYSLDENDFSRASSSAGQHNPLQEKLRADYTPLQGFCVMLFCLISTPCVATLAITRKETGSWKWALFQFCSLTAAAYILTLAVYQIGRIIIN